MDPHSHLICYMRLVYGGFVLFLFIYLFAGILLSSMPAGAEAQVTKPCSSDQECQIAHTCPEGNPICNHNLCKCPLQNVVTPENRDDN